MRGTLLLCGQQQGKTHNRVMIIKNTVSSKCTIVDVVHAQNNGVKFIFLLWLPFCAEAVMRGVQIEFVK